MEAIPLPKNCKFIEEQGNKSVFVLEPCYPGYGVTIGNAIRRVLLSSLPGAAVTAIKIKGVDHEFSTIPNVKEDVVEIILNIKQLCLKSHSQEPVRVSLKAKGEKKVTAAMIEKNDQIEIVHPDLHIATLDGKGAELDMELNVEQGRGYVTVEAREDERMEIGMIAIDAIFTPIRNVNFSVENVRVGKMTNYDKLTMHIVTNGTITGREALDAAARIAVDHFQLLLKENFETAEEPATEISVPVTPAEEPVPEQKSDAGLETSVNVASELLPLNLSKRSYNALVKNKITRVEQLKKLTENELRQFRGLGTKSIEEVLQVIAKL
ncbi:MAG: DNA-directed RNA polymerase subunit alpha [Candidatus Doudnabacteria bacterium]|nr:DNA-directed RNA polymerase subunit alpha [Candidatus Doudnabacteria bacterium]